MYRKIAFVTKHPGESASSWSKKNFETLCQLCTTSEKSDPTHPTPTHPCPTPHNSSPLFLLVIMKENSSAKNEFVFSSKCFHGKCLKSSVKDGKNGKKKGPEMVSTCSKFFSERGRIFFEFFKRLEVSQMYH